MCSGGRDREHKGTEVAEGLGGGDSRESPSGRVKGFRLRPAPGSWRRTSHRSRDKTLGAEQRTFWHRGRLGAGDEPEPGWEGLGAGRGGDESLS